MNLKKKSRRCRGLGLDSGLDLAISRFIYSSACMLLAKELLCRVPECLSSRSPPLPPPQASVAPPLDPSGGKGGVVEGMRVKEEELCRGGEWKRRSCGRGGAVEG
jgi:hypothetical protein